MADNLAKKRPQDYSRINVHEEWELKYWTEALGVSAEKLKETVNKVGPAAVDVKKALKS
jgi:hypothetical protein